MRTPRKDMFVNITTTIWIVSNLTTYLFTGDLSIVAVIKHGILTISVLNAEGQKGNALVK